MNVLQVTPAYYPAIGGVEKHVQALSERLAACGHDVTVATMRSRGASPSSEQHNRVRIRRFEAVGPGEAYRVPVGLVRYLKETRNQWDIVHVHNYHAALIPLVALAGIRPFVVTTHLNDTPHSKAAQLLHVPYRLVGRWAVGQAQAVICVTAAEQQRIASRLGVPSGCSVVIPNGVGEGLLAARGSSERDTHLLLSVGRLQAYKRVADAVSALALLEQPYRLVVVGAGPERDHLEQLAAGTGLGGRIDFVGSATDAGLVDWYRRAGVVLALSEAEAFGMTVLEGVAAGCQVVCSDIPAFKDLAAQFPGHVTVVPLGDVHAVARAIRNVSARQADAADLSGWTWQSVAEQTIKLYERVTG